MTSDGITFLFLRAYVLAVLLAGCRQTLPLNHHRSPASIDSLQACVDLFFIHPRALLNKGEFRESAERILHHGYYMTAGLGGSVNHLAGYAELVDLVSGASLLDDHFVERLRQWESQWLKPIGWRLSILGIDAAFKEAKTMALTKNILFKKEPETDRPWFLPPELYQVLLSERVLFVAELHDLINHLPAILDSRLRPHIEDWSSRMVLALKDVPFHERVELQNAYRFIRNGFWESAIFLLPGQPRLSGYGGYLSGAINTDLMHAELFLWMSVPEDPKEAELYFFHDQWTKGEFNFHDRGLFSYPVVQPILFNWRFANRPQVLRRLNQHLWQIRESIRRPTTTKHTISSRSEWRIVRLHDLPEDWVEQFWQKLGQAIANDPELAPLFSLQTVIDDWESAVAKFETLARSPGSN